jgi:hypothetical protein
LFLGVAPILLKGTLLPIGDSNADPTSYSAATSFLRASGMHSPIPLSLEHPINVPVYGILHTTNDRLGFEFFQVHVNVLSGTTPPQTFSVISAFGLFLWSLAAGFTATTLLPAIPAAALLATLLFSMSAFPLWIAYGGYGAQVLGMGLLIMAFNAWAVAFEEHRWRAVGLAAVLSAGLAGIYSDCLPYLLLATLALALGFTVFVYGPRQWRQTVTVLTAGAAVSILLNPVGWARAVPHFLWTTRNPTAGNVDWIVDPRQVAGAVPFGRNVTGWFGDVWTSVLWIAAAIMLLLVVYGFISLGDRSALIAACFIAPHLASFGWFYYREDPYGYFKAWSMGVFLYAVLLAAGLTMLRNRERRPTIVRPASILALSSLAVCLAVSSVVLAGSMTARFSCTPSIAELESWVGDIDAKDEIYVSTGSLPPVSAYWIAYYLRQHPLHFSSPLLYTAYEAQPFRGEPWLIRYRQGETEDDAALESATVVRQNESFRLLSFGAKR